MKLIPALSLMIGIAAAGSPFAAVAADEHDAAHGNHAGVAAGKGNDITDGEIKKVDKSAGKVTIKHGELKNLDMGPMTMIFRVKDKAMLDQVKAGDKVRFVADKLDGKLTVMRFEPAQ